MKITVLPIRDPGRPERPERPAPAPPPPRARSGFEGMPPSTIEILHGARKRLAPAPRPPAAASAPPAPAAPAAPHPPEQERAAASVTAVEIDLPNGMIVRVPPGFASADLERALAIAAGNATGGGGAPEGR